ncbi:MAG TPA: hypothetical protein VF607_16745 [Verrucomicrobiae bacterium]
MKSVSDHLSLMAVAAAAAFAGQAQEAPSVNVNPALAYYQAYLLSPPAGDTDRDYLFNNDWRGQKLPPRVHQSEIDALAEKLASVESGPVMETSAAFHRRVMCSVRAEKKSSRWAGWIARNWFWASAGFATLLVALVAAIAVRPVKRAEPPVMSVPPSAKVNFDPTFANYQRVANQSLEKLDELLTLQGTRSLPPAPPYPRAAAGLAD